jgi:ATP-dependent DNA ligase
MPAVGSKYQDGSALKVLDVHRNLHLLASVLDDAGSVSSDTVSEIVGRMSPLERTELASDRVMLEQLAEAGPGLLPARCAPCSGVSYRRPSRRGPPRWAVALVRDSRTLVPVPAREDRPRFAAPMLARNGPVPVGEGWAVEVKFDGMRLQLRRDGRAVCLRSRPGRNCSEEFPELAAIAGVLGRHRVLLDGELVCLGADGSPDFASLRRRLRAPADKARRHAERWPATFLAFDLLHLDGHSTRELPYERRRELLLKLGAMTASAADAASLRRRLCVGAGRDP